MLSPRGDGSVIDAPGCGKTALHWASARGAVEDVEALLEAGHGLNGRDAEGRTALHWAVLKGRPEIAALLLERGADADAADAAQRTPLMTAAWLGRAELLGVLADAGCSVRFQNADGATALAVACSFGQSAAALALLARPPYADDAGHAAPRVGKNVLQCAFERGYSRPGVATLFFIRPRVLDERGSLVHKSGKRTRIRPR